MQCLISIIYRLDNIASNILTNAFYYAAYYTYFRRLCSTFSTSPERLIIFRRSILTTII